MNHFNADLPEGLWWTQQPMMEPTPKTLSSKHKGLIPQPNHPWSSHHQHHHQVWLGSQEAATASMFCGQNNTLSFNLNEEEDEDLDEQLTDERETLTKEEEEGEEEEEREAMFEKPLTPSDVGKLNRLVIPKQHAEKYFPLGGGGGGDSGDKGLLLSFEDESGKCWRFRYSYWNSSQSYVLTKGWSRFVKEKRLDAGDVVLFQRHRTDGDRLFIGWRRRAAPVQDIEVAQPAMPPPPTAGWTQVLCCIIGSVGPTQTTPAVNSKRLRLFGVNMECQIDESSEEPVTHHGPSLSSQGPAHHQFHSGGQGSNHHNHMDINFSRDVNQMRNRRG